VPGLLDTRGIVDVVRGKEESTERAKNTEIQNTPWARVPVPAAKPTNKKRT
jgi:hypothetical protein